MKTVGHLSYIGIRDPEDGCEVIVKDHLTNSSRPLSMRLDLFNHSPTGFEWSYSGSGPAQTALAILANHFIDKEHHAPALLALGLTDLPSEDERMGNEIHEYLAVRLHQTFKFRVIAGLPREGWELHEDEIDRILIGMVKHEATA